MNQPIRRVRIAISTLLVTLGLAGPVVGAEQAALPEIAAHDANSNWVLRLSTDAPVVYEGEVGFDDAGTGAGFMMYPAPNPAGFLASILIHGLFMESVRKTEKDKIQTAADRILEPYRPFLDSIRVHDLMRRAVALFATAKSVQLIESSAPAPSTGQSRVVTSVPLFFLTQDQSALVLDNAVEIRQPSTPSDKAYQNIIRVVSSTQDAADLAAQWSHASGALFFSESARLLAHSIDLALRDSAAATNAEALPYRTVRYQQGRAEKIERAQLISASCDRMLIRTLRGYLMSVPVSRATETAGAVGETCKVAPQ